jgi:hypothetical protein
MHHTPSKFTLWHLVLLNPLSLTLLVFGRRSRSFLNALKKFDGRFHSPDLVKYSATNNRDEYGCGQRMVAYPLTASEVLRR